MEVKIILKTNLMSENIKKLNEEDSWEEWKAGIKKIIEANTDLKVIKIDL